MPETVEIGLGRSARRGYHLDDIALVPTRRTRGSSVVSTSWQIDAHAFDLPLVAAPSDAIVSPATAVEIERLGGLAVLDGEGLWARYDDPDAELADARRRHRATLQRVYSPAGVARAAARSGSRELRASGRAGRRAAVAAAHRRPRAARAGRGRRPARHPGHGHLGRARRRARTSRG